MVTKQVDNRVLIPEVAKLIADGHSVTMQVKGRSMRPFVEHERDKVVLEAPAGDVCKGQVVLARVGEDHYVLHRVVNVTNDQITLRGDGNVLGTETCKPSDVFAIATGFIRGRRSSYVGTGSWRWRAYSWIWGRLLPVRRYLLAFHRLIWLPLFK